MLTTELCARLCADFPLQLPDAPACFACTRVVLDPWDDAEGGTVFIGEGTVDRPDRFYLLCAPGAPQHPNAAHYADPALTLPLVRAVHRLLEPERRLQRRLHRLEQACLSGGLKDLLAAARQELGNPCWWWTAASAPWPWSRNSPSASTVGTASCRAKRLSITT